MRRRIAPIALGCGLALGLLEAGAARATVGVRIDSPEEGSPVFGKTEIKAELFAAEPVVKVEFYVNGKLVGTATTPPWAVTFEAGDENIKREIKVVVYGKTGIAGSATRVSQPLQIDDTMDLKLQQLFITVSRGEQRALDLEQGDFRIADNGKTQQIVTFGKGELPLTAMLLLDTSESMQGERLEAARRGARVFLGGMRPDDEASLLMFSDRLLRVTPFSQDRGELEQALAETEAVGGTSVNDFLYMSLKLLDARIGRRAVILLSDGFDVHSVLPIEEVLWKARTSQSLIYWIQLDDDAKEKSFNSAWRDHVGNDKEYQTLKKTVEESGGRILSIQRIGELEFAFASIMKEMREQYVIGYYPTEFKKDGRWHKISVDVKRPGVKVRVREGYVDY
jgi:Ca-activated chloride channel family protein